MMIRGDYLVTYYNSASQPITIYTYAQGQQIQIVSNTYDGSGNLSTALTFGAADNETYDTFDTSGNKTAETVAFGSADAATTDYQYNASGKVTQVTDPDGNVTLFTFDDKGNELSMTDPSGNVEAMTYNDKGLLDTETNRNGLKIDYTYDDSGRETEEDWYASDGTTITETDTWTYTPDGKIATASNSQGTYAFKYNDAGQLIHVGEPFGVSLDFAYDDNGNRILVKDSLGGTEESNYNASNQLISRILVQGSETMRIDMTYDQYGRVATETRYSDAAGTSLVGKTTYTYDAFGNVSSILNTDASNATIDEFDYEYNLAGQLLSETDLQPAISSSPVTDTYTYDDQEELTGDGTNSYDYDLNGNRNTGNTYDTTNTNLLLSNGTWDYGYDDEGNMTGKVNISTGEQWTYGYNNKNELIQAKQFDASSTLEMEADYKYDVFGNRDEKDVTTGGVTTVQRSVLDGWNPAKPTPTGNENFDVIADLDGGNAEVTRYLRGDGVDELHGRVDQSGASNPAGTYWTLSDHLGSTRDVINNSGVVKDAIQYDSYGNINTLTETDAAYLGRYAWTGREFDVETQLQCNRERYYDATTGRWISQDPLGFDAGDSNLYRYTNNQPNSYIDPPGLFRRRVRITSQGPNYYYSPAIPIVGGQDANQNQTRDSYFQDPMLQKKTGTVIFSQQFANYGLIEVIQFKGSGEMRMMFDAGKGETLARSIAKLKASNPRFAAADHFNWYQISLTTSDGTVQQKDYRSYNTKQVQQKFNQWYVDPDAGGQGDGKGNLAYWTDDLPWYFDEGLPPANLKSNTPYSPRTSFLGDQLLKPDFTPANALNQAQYLRYFDQPIMRAGLTIQFKTYLTVVDATGRPVCLSPWYFSWEAKAVPAGPDNTAVSYGYNGFRLLPTPEIPNDQYLDLIGDFKIPN